MRTCTRGLAVLAVALAGLMASPSAAQAPPDPSTADPRPASLTLDAVRLDGAITIDGRIEEAAWATAPVAGDFVQLGPEPGAPASERTEALVLYDDDALYAAFRCYVRDPATLIARLARRDEYPGSDRVSVDIDSRNDGRSGYFFAVTAGGTLQDGLLLDDVDVDESWDAVYEAQVARTDYGWSAELRIPLSQLRFRAGADTWGVQFQRDIAHRGELTFWAPILPTERGYVSRFGTLRGLDGLRPRARVEVVPYAAARLERPLDESIGGLPADPFYEPTARRLSAGADLELGVGSDLTLNATFNPDFGQVEADPAVLNLTQFENFFEERRPFFVEGTEIFQFGRTQTLNSDFRPRDFFYSRRIGAEPGYPYPSSALYVQAPTESTIAGAAKFSGRIGDWSLGVLNAVTTSETGRFVGLAEDGALTAAEAVTVQPWANYGVGRIRRDFRGGRSVVGGLLTTTHRALGDHPVLTARLPASATTLGLDFEHAFAGRDWIVSGVGAASHVRGSEEALVRLQRAAQRRYQRPDADYVAIDSSATSLSGAYGQLSVGKFGGNWRGSLTATTLTPGFELNDLGFMTRADVVSLASSVRYVQPEPAAVDLRFWSVTASQGLAWSYGGDRIATYLRLFADAEFESRWIVYGSVTGRPEVYDIRLTRGGPVMREPARVGGFAGLLSDPSRPLAAEAELDFEGTGLGGVLLAPRLTFIWRPVPAARVELESFVAWQDNPLQYYGAADDPAATATFGRRYLFADTRSTELALTTRLDWTFTPNLSLQLFLRPSVFAVDYGQLKVLERPRTYDLRDLADDQIADEDGFLAIDADGDPATADTFALFRQDDFNDRFLQGTAVLRWEYRPGATVFLVWQHQRAGFDLLGDFDARRDLGALFDLPAENIFLVKATYWLGR